ncbi:MAG: hypothetical protein L0332_07030 [Chloroflexi bacterium]|nr:hypothetical protein [Chloroflexota bacterium]MCI0579171.1 hypothetical protein [Chloroflexota bacterium]MCI0647952.1 hypothetical protein [Chloroflexota bacterium]MCI0726462.1 hypothetical protein [Chloroflexota bacterium]
MTDELYRLLLQRLTGASAGPEAEATTQEMLAQMVAADPRLQWVHQYLAQRQAANAQEAHNLSAFARESDDSQLRAVRQLRQQMKALMLELQELRERNDSLAAALGACYLCWGEDPECSYCAGRGRPGYAAPDKALFMAWVAPAGRALKNQNLNVESGR